MYYHHHFDFTLQLARMCSSGILCLTDAHQRCWIHAFLGWVLLLLSYYHWPSWLSLFLGLTIETVSSTNLIISIGLCVDCPAHIAHEFLASQGIWKISEFRQITRCKIPSTLYRHQSGTEQKGFEKYGTSSAEWGLQYLFIFRPFSQFRLTCIWDFFQGKMIFIQIGEVNVLRTITYVLRRSK